MTAYVPVPRVVVEELVSRPWSFSDAPIVADLAHALHREEVEHASTERRERPPWHVTEKAVRQYREIIARRGPMAVAELDQLRATIRGEFDKIEVSLHDERAIFDGFVWVGLVTEIARYGYSNGRIDVTTYEAIAAITATIGAAIVDYVPKDVGRG